MDYKQLTAPCGRDCFNCSLYHARDNEKLRGIVAKKYKLDPETAFCNGCRAEDGIIEFVGMKKPCPIFSCAEAREVEFCGDCQNFPCDHLQPIAHLADKFDHNTKVYNLCLIKKMGLENWAEQKAKEVKESYFTKKLHFLILD